MTASEPPNHRRFDLTWLHCLFRDAHNKWSGIEDVAFDYNMSDKFYYPGWDGSEALLIKLADDYNSRENQTPDRLADVAERLEQMRYDFPAATVNAAFLKDPNTFRAGFDEGVRHCQDVIVNASEISVTGVPPSDPEGKRNGLSAPATGQPELANGARCFTGDGARELRGGEWCKEQPDACPSDFMTVVFNRSAKSFDKNPMHIKSEFGDAVAICQGDALEELDRLRETERESIDLQAMRQGWDMRKEQLVALANLADAYEAGFKDGWRGE